MQEQLIGIISKDGYVELEDGRRFEISKRGIDKEGYPEVLINAKSVGGDGWMHRQSIKRFIGMKCWFITTNGKDGFDFEIPHLIDFVFPKEKEEVLMNNFQLIDEKLFVQYSSHSHMHQVDQFEARLLNKYGVDICWCSIKKDGAEFTAYLADLSYGHNKIINKIGSKLIQSRLAIFQELDPNHGKGK